MAKEAQRLAQEAKSDLNAIKIASRMSAGTVCPMPCVFAFDIKVGLTKLGQFARKVFSHK